MREKGFSLIEMMAVVAFFTIITGSVFLLLNASQQRYKMEAQMLDAFQTARLAIDQMDRDVHGAGFPPTNSFWSGVAQANPQNIAVPFAWAPNYLAYPGAPACTVGAACGPPGPFDLIVEGALSPSAGGAVQWIRYTLQGTTLMRGVVAKTAGTDPVVATSAAGVMLPYVDNVMNNGTPAQMAAIRASYPTMFPANTPVPIFTYECDDSNTPPIPRVCTNGLVVAPNNTAPYIRQVGITLIVQAAQPDPKTKQPRIASLHSEAFVLNPTQ